MQQPRLNLRKIFILFFIVFFLSSNNNAHAINCKWKLGNAFKIVGQVNNFQPLHPISTLAAISSPVFSKIWKSPLVKFINDFRQAQKKGTPAPESYGTIASVQEVGKTKTHTRYLVSDHNKNKYIAVKENDSFKSIVITTKDGTVSEIIESPASYPPQSKDLGQTLRQLNGGKTDASPQTQKEIQKIILQLFKKEFILKNSDTTLVKLLSSLSKESLEVLKKGYNFQVEAATLSAYPLGISGLIYTAKGSNKLVVRLADSQGKVEISGSDGRINVVSTKEWNQITQQLEVKKGEAPESLIAKNLEDRKKQLLLRQQQAFETISFAPKVLIYPTIVPYRIAEIFMRKYKKSILSTAVETIRKDGLILLAYTFVILPRYQIIQLVAQLEQDEEEKEKKGEQVDLEKFWDITEKAFDEDNYPVIGINLVSPQDALFYVGRNSFDKAYSQQKGSKMYDVGSVSELTSTLKRIYEENGPIQRLELYGHGNFLEINSLLVGSDYLVKDDSAISKITHKLDLQVQETKRQLEAQGIKNPIVKHALDGKIHHLYELEELKGIFAPNAKIRFVSCTLANGENGEAFLKDIGSRWLDQGGNIMGSPKVISLHYNINDLPPWMKEKAINEMKAKKYADFLELEKRSPAQKIYDFVYDELGRPVEVAKSLWTIHRLKNKADDPETPESILAKARIFEIAPRKQSINP